VSAAESGTDGGAAASLSDSLDGLTPQARRSKILDVVRRTTAELLGHIGSGELESGATFLELGMDSVTLVELRSALGRAVGVRLPSVVLFDHPTPERITDWLLERSGADAAEADAVGVDTGEVADRPAWARAIPRATAPEDDPVVVVGAACRFPGGIDTPESLWEALSSGRDLRSGFPTDRGWPAELFDPDPHATGHSSVDRGGFLTGAGEFDAGFFGISPREATAMDPQQRVLLQCAWEAVERAGVDLREPVTTGVFLGAFAQDYGPRMDRPAAGLDGYLLTGTTTSVVSGRVAYVMGLEGPALTVDTACSSSLVALHLAASSLRAGECDRALVGGATVMASPGIFVEFSRQGGLAPDGRCKSFAAAADGTGWSEGAGVVLLERLSAARRAGHRVLAVVRGTAVNSDGSTNGLSAPSGVAQQRVIRAALTSAGVEARDVDAVEAHGTGTRLGDPIEAGALVAAYGTGRTEPLSLGSAKSVLGHTQAAAGVAGLLATILGFEHEELPATRHVDAPSPHVDWDTGTLTLRTAPRPWPRRAGRPRLAGISAFGISGTNAHVILEEPPAAPELERPAGHRSAPMPWVCSAVERERLDVLTALLAGLPDDADPAPVAAALARRVPHRYRAVLDGVTRETLALGTVSGRCGRGAVFVFPGDGAQWVGMGAELLAAGDNTGDSTEDRDPDPHAEVFAHRLRECAAAVLAAGGRDVLAVLRDDDPAALDDVVAVQPASWAVMVALAAVWESAGVAPAAVVGHSQGEIAAAVVAGALSVEDGARVVVSRAKVLRSVAGTGAVASIAEPADAVRERLVGEVGIAAENAPGATVISGPVDEVAAVAAAAAEAGVRTRVLPLPYASHSPSMESLRPQVLEALNGVRIARPRVPWFSTTEVGWITDERSEDYWMDNLSRPVRFGAAIQALLDEGYGVFVETSTHPVLVAAIEETAEATAHEVATTGSLRRGEGGPARLLTALAQGWVLGVEVNWTGLLPPARVPADLPTYPFRADRYWAMRESRESADPAGSGAPSAVPDPESARLWAAVDRGDVEALGRALELDERATLAEVVPRLGAWRRRRGDERRTDSWRYRIGWRPLEDRPHANSDPLLLLLPAGEHARVAELADALAAVAPGTVGHVVDAADPARDIAAAVRAHRAGAVVSLLGLGATPDATHDRPPVTPAVGDALTALRAVLDAARDDGPVARLWWVTLGGVSVEPPRRAAVGDGAPDPSTAVDGPPDPWAAQVWGLGRVAALEHPGHWGGLVDLPGPAVPEQVGTAGDTAGDTATLAARLVAAIRRDDGEDQIAVRAAGTFGRRLWRARAAGDPDAAGAGRSDVARFTTRGTAIVTGGTGALGAHIARWLADAGAEHLVLVGRRGPDTDGAPALRAELEERGVRTSLVACDVTDPDAVAALVDRYPPDLVVHAAGVGARAPLAELGSAEVEDVARAKIAGAQNLHTALGDRPLDGFVLFSSISAVWGVADQGAYAAANAHLDALAARRTSAGLPALSVAWGPWSGGGMITESLGESMARVGVPPIEPAPAVVALGRALVLGDPAVAVAEVDWATFAPVFASSRQTRLLDDLPEALAALAPAPTSVSGGAVPGGAATEGDAASGFGRRVASVDADEGRRLVRELVNSELSAVLGYTGTDVVDGSRAFSELGVDSLGAVKLRRALREATGVAMATTIIYDHPTPDRLAGWLFGRLRPAPGSDTDHATPVTARASVEDDPVVIVAAACRFPGGIANPEQLWEMVAAGGDGTSALPDDRGWPVDLVDTDPAAAGHSTVGRGGFLAGAGDFDAGFFGISPREATAMDPQQRVLLECTWEALERAGVEPRSLRGSRTGVYVGLGDSDYARLLRGDGEAEGHLITGAANSVASGRIAYVLGLEGPALTVDTACSSALVALHLAVRSLRAGECDQALVGGAMIMVNPDQFIGFSRQRALAPDGRCKPFAAAADGFALSEGAAVVMIERQSAAHAAGHPVLAVLRGSAVNSDGASNGLSAPNGLAQQRVLRDALRDAGVGPADIDAVETHGTGTELGDPIEAGALLEVFGTERDEPLWIGSLKSNVGHTQTVAGLGGLIKTMLAMQHGVLPATVHVDAPSPHVAWESGAVELLTESRPWPKNGHPRRAGVSSFGISGTNAHVVLEEPPLPPVRLAGADRSDAGQATPDRTELVAWPVSARGADELADLAVGLADHVERTGEPADAVGAALVRRTAFEERAVVLASGDDLSGALDDLRALAAGEVPAAAARGTADTGARGVVFVFPGQGAQWVGMGRELLGGGGRSAGVFVGRLRECSVAVVAVGGPDVFAVLGDEDSSALDDVGVVQPVSWAVMVALAAVWVDAGVVPAAVVGHSQGEIAAAVVAGALSVADGAKVVVSRAMALRSLAGTGAMASIAEPEDVVAARIASSPGAHAVSVAVVNGPGATVVSGPAEQVRDLVEAMSKAGARTRVLPVDYASHSPMVDELAFETVAGRAPDIRWYSTVHPGWVDSGLPGEYWAENLRRPVRFAEAVGALLAEGFDAFVEVSAHPVLVAAIEETAEAASAEVSVTPTLCRGEGGPARLLSVLAKAWTRGAAVDWSNFVTSAGPAPVLPTYPFRRQRFWPVRPTAAEVSGTSAPVDAEDASFWAAVERTDTEALTRALDVSADLVPALADVVPALAGWRRDRELRVRSAAWHQRLVWRPVELAPAAAPEPRPWLLVVPDGEGDGGEGDGTAVSALRAALVAAGQPEPSVLVVGPDESRAELAERLRNLTGTTTGTEPGAVVSTLGLTPRDPSGSDLAGSTERTVTLVQALVDAAVGGPWWWLTRHAVSTTPGEAPDAVLGQLWGLGLVVGLDHPDHWGGVLDLGSLDPIDLVEAVRIVGGNTGEEQLAVRGGRVLARRLVAAAPPPAPAPWRTSGTAVVTGGTGALGRQVARWLAQHGAEHLVLTSRRGPAAPGAAALADELRAGGVRVDLVAGDLGVPEGRAALGAALAGHPVRTVVHAAGVAQREAPLAEQTVDDVAAMLAAKVGGADYLDALFADTELDAFVLFSSGAATWGNVGGAGYAAANAHLDTLAARRRAEGRPALSVAWGSWAGGGMVDGDHAAALLARGIREMAPDAALAALGSLLGAGAGPTAVVSDMDWARFADIYTARRARRLLDEHEAILRARADAGSSGTEAAGGATGEQNLAATGLRGRLGRAGSDAERVRIAVDAVRRTAAAALGHDQVSAVSPRRSFTELGFESLTAVEFRNRLAVVTGVRLAATAVYDHPTPLRLAEHLIEQMGPLGDSADATAPAETAGPVGVLAALAALESALDLAQESGPGAGAADEDLDALANRLRRLADRHSDHRSVADHAVVDLDAVSDDEMFNLIDQEFGAA
jgi:acyl transferase domain-containing protein/acyl carrier protein